MIFEVGFLNIIFFILENVFFSFQNVGFIATLYKIKTRIPLNRTNDTCDTEHAIIFIYRQVTLFSDVTKIGHL